MIIFLYGSDDYRREKKSKSIIEEYKKKRSSLAINEFDFSDSETFVKFNDFLGSTSLFENLKLGILKNIFEEKNEKFAGLLKSAASDSGIVLLIISRESPPKNFSFLLESPITSQPFEELESEKLSFFIKKEANDLGLSLSPSAVSFLAEYYKGNSWGVATELQKLSFLSNREVSLDFLKNNGLTQSQDFFPLINGLKKEGRAERLSSLEMLFSQGEDAAKIFNILAYSDSGKMKRFADYDYKIKSGKFDYDEALLDFVL